MLAHGRGEKAGGDGCREKGEGRRDEMSVSRRKDGGKDEWIDKDGKRDQRVGRKERGRM